MPTLEQTVYVDVDLDDFDEEDLIKELEDRGFYVGVEGHDIIAIENTWNRGDKKEALVLLERKFPELIGISKLID
jgi:hypothetical protein